ncbi:MAG: tRNA (N6-isopentenyl adenosine(37)-C2)-methylthiotransferase MiaB, partial [Deefgea sp.]
KSGISQVDISFPEIEKFDHMPPARVEGGAAYVSIMEGCSKYCSFCVVPYTRGEEVSRPFEDILTEVAHLAQQGVKELHLLGQNVNAYRGVILDGSDEGETADLATLLEYVHEIPGIERIRYTTSHPKEMTARIIDCYRTLPKLCSQLHLPVQAGSDRVLVNMKRGYTTLEYKSVIRKLREARPDLCFSSDFIVGFPGETEEDFERTMKLIEDVGFDTSYSFVYSRRPGTPAADLPDDVPEEIKLARLQRMQKRLEQQAEAINLAMVGSIQRVMVERFAKKDKTELAGRTDNNRIVNFEGNPRLMNQFVHVKITDAFPRSLRGEIVTQEI